jgi:Ran GTPase-activating protein (RanGAP) involved in mRNA processing and transport
MGLTTLSLGTVQWKELRLSYDTVEEAGLLALAGALGGGACPDLRQLRFPCTPTAIRQLANAISNRALARLEGLRLCGTAIRDDDAAPLLRALKDGAYPTLRVLSLSGSEVGDETCSLTIRAMREGALPELKELGLADNRISDAGAEELAEALQAGAGAVLTRLDLANNGLGPAARERLLGVAGGACPQMPPEGLRLEPQRG